MAELDQRTDDYHPKDALGNAIKATLVTGGAGAFSGGVGQTIALRNDTGYDMRVFSMANRTLFPATGLFGGGAGAMREHWIGEKKVSGQGSYILAPGATMTLKQAGGGGYGDPAWLRSELELVRSETRRPWGVGFITWSIDRALVDLALSYQPHAVMLSFGDPRPYAKLIKDSGCRLICQVQDVAGARSARPRNSSA